MFGSEPVPPLMLTEGWDLTFFRSHGDLTGYVEPWYVEEEGQAWDALGRPLELVVVEEPPSGLLRSLRRPGGHVEARLRDAVAEPDPGCEAYLREWLLEVGSLTMPADASLADLLVQALVRTELR